MKKEKRFELIPPVGNIVTLKEVMTEKEVREYAVQIEQDPAHGDTWKEKIENDPIESVVDWLVQMGYQVKQV